MRRIGLLRSDASPSKVARDRMAADDAHHQPRAGAGIAEIENRPGLGKAADSHAAHAPASLGMTLDRGAELAASLGGAQHVVAFEEALDPRFADRQKAENERPMRGRFVAGNAHAAGKGAGAFRRERPCLDRSGAGHAHPLLRGDALEIVALVAPSPPGLSRGLGEASSHGNERGGVSRKRRRSVPRRMCDGN